MSRVVAVCGLLAAALSLATLPCGCWRYTVSGSPYAHIRDVAVVPFDIDPRITDYGLVDLVTSAVEEGLVVDNTLRVSSQAGADAIVRGQIQEARDEPFTYTSSETARQYRFKIRVLASCYDKTRQKVLWERPIEGWGIYAAPAAEAGVEAVASAPSAGREGGRREAAAMIAREIVERMVSGW